MLTTGRSPVTDTLETSSQCIVFSCWENVGTFCDVLFPSWNICPFSLKKNIYRLFFFLLLHKEWKLMIFAAVSISASRTALTTARYSRRTAADRFLDDFLDNCIHPQPSNSISPCVIYRRVTALSMSNRELSGGGFGWSVGLDLAGTSGAFWEVTEDLRTCRMGKKTDCL